MLGPNSTRDESVLVLNDWQSSSAASAACSALGESLWTPSTADFLPYLSYLGKAGLYHAADGCCAHITENGFEGLVDNCSGEYPALCTNSAPYTTSVKADNSSAWQVQVQGDEYTSFTG